MLRASATLLDIKTIYHEPTVPTTPRGAAILERFPEAERIIVPSHWNIPELHRNADLAEEWNRIKRTVLVLGTKKGLRCTPYERSADFVAPSTANGCAMACSYCYVARRKGYANPITTFVNIEQIGATIERHAAKQGPKGAPTAADPDYWVYELGTNSDGGVDALISDNIRDLVALFRRLPNAKATFSTKWVNRELLDYDPQGKTRLRVSLMPPAMARIVDVRTAPIRERIAAINDYVAAGYEVNVNFAPVIWYEGWLDDYRELFDHLDAVLSPATKVQLAAEVIFMTHNEELHEVNQRWHPRAEEWLWCPDFQEEKISGGGGRNVRYRLEFKRGLVAEFRRLLNERMPYCAIRYAF